MKKLIYGLINNRKITLFFVFALIAAGIFGYMQNPKQESPDFSIPYAMITTVYPGASQSDVDSYVTEPIEKELMKIEGYDSTTAYSSNNLSLIILELKFSTDRDNAFQEIKDAMLTLQKSLPKECETINVNTNITDTAGVLFCLSSDTLKNTEIVSEAEYIADKLSDIDGFLRFEIIGKSDMVVSVVADETKMQQAGTSFSEITSIIEAGNLDIPIGSVKENGESLALDYSGGYKDINDIKNLEIGISPETGQLIYLKDVADITYSAESSNASYTFNGNEAVIIAGYFEDNINVLPLKDEITDKLDDIKDMLPSSLETSLIVSQPDEIDNSLNDFAKNLLMAVGLVILVVLIGMGIRNAVVVSVSLPLSVLIAMGVMYLLDIKIHQVSIAALIVSLGMLVDNSIVVSDSIQGYLDKGKDRINACANGVRNVALPVLTSTITTIAAFMPFLLLNSIAGDYIKSLPQIVSISLAASYLTAMLVIPVLGFIFFKPNGHSKKKHGLKFFKKLLKSGLKNRALVIACVAILIAGSVYLAMDLDTIFFPAADKDIIYIDIKNNKSDDVESTRKIVNEISELLSNEKGITDFTASAGSGLPRFNQIMYVYTKTPDIGQIMMRVNLEQAGYDTNEEYKLYLQEKIDELNLDSKITVKELMYAFPMDEDIKIRIVGDNADTLKTYEDTIYSYLSNKEELVNVAQSNSYYTDEYSMLVDSQMAVKNGLVTANVQNEISIALMGRSSSTINVDGYDAKVIVSGDYLTKTDLESIPIKNASGTYVNAGEIIDLDKISVLSTLPRYNGEYSLSITADYNLDYDKNETLNEIKDYIDELDLTDAEIIYDGEDELIKENFGDVGILGIVALILVFMILMIQFKSFLMPLIIFITIPLSAIGSIAGLWITGLPISFTALLGIVSLLGIVVNNAIILIDYIKKEQAKGLAIKKACIKASQKRLRPILLSTITTVIGLIPLAISNSELFKPLAIALMFGLMISTLLTLVVLPVFISFTEKIK